MHDLNDLPDLNALPSNLTQRNKRMFNNVLMSDVNFIVKDTETGKKVAIPAHKYVLSIGSPVFYKMFYGDLAEASNSVEVVDADSNSLLELLRFLYSDETNLTAGCVLQVMYLAEKYMVTGLLDECSEFLKNEIDAENAFEVLTQCEHFRDTEELEERCWSIVDLQTRKCLRSRSFLATSERILDVLLRRETLDIYEDELFRAVLFWAEAKCRLRSIDPIAQNVKKAIGGAMSHIRFSCIADKEILNRALESGILDNDAWQASRGHTTPRSKRFVREKFNHDFPLRTIVDDSNLCVRQRQGIKPLRCRRLFMNEPPRLFAPYESKHSVSFITDQPVCMYGVRVISSGRKLNDNYAVITKLLDSNRSCNSCVKGTYIVEYGGTEGLPGFDVYFEEPVLIKKGAKYFITIFSPTELDLPQRIGKKDEVHCAGVNFYFPDSTHRQFPELIFHPLAPLWRTNYTEFKPT